MRIELMVDDKPCFYEVQPGTLLSEVLQTEQAVWLEGRLIDSRLMLAAQAHGRQIELKAIAPSLAPLQESLLAPEPSRC